MKLNSKKTTRTIRCNLDKIEFANAANGDSYCSTKQSLEISLNNAHQSVIYIAKDMNLAEVIKLAFDYKATLYLTDKVKYDFSKVKLQSSSVKSNYVLLVAAAHETTLLQHALVIASEELKHKVPYNMSFKQAKKLLASHVDNKFDVKEAISVFERIYNKHLNEVKKFIAPENHPKIKKVKLSYKSDLLEFFKNNDGIFVLNGKMGTGKSIYGVTEPFNYWCNSRGVNPIVITPDIALSKQIVSVDDIRHYQNKSLRKSLQKTLPTLNGLVCCVNSTTTNDSMYEYACSSGVIFIEEFEECALSLSQNLIKNGKLSERAQATDRFFNLLKTKKIIIADALFSDLSARQIIEETGRDIFIIEPADAHDLPSRTMTITNRNVHFKQLIESIEQTSTQVGFSDQGQSYSRKFFESSSLVTKNASERLGLNVKTLIINAQFLKSKLGRDFLVNFEQNLAQYDYIQISPALTSGLNFPFETVTKVNLLSSMTILPTQLIQSSGRFRKAFEFIVSFIKTSADFHTDHNIIKNCEIYHHTKSDDLGVESLKVSNNPSVERVVERIAHNNLMRQNYENTTLILFELLGFNIEFDRQTKHNEVYATKITTEQLLEAKTLNTNEYAQIKPQYEGLKEYGVCQASCRDHYAMHSQL